MTKIVTKKKLAAENNQKAQIIKSTLIKLKQAKKAES